MVEHPPQPALLVPEPVEAPTAGPAGEPAPEEAVQQPAKVMRIGSMIKQLLEEVRRAPLDDAGRERLREIYQTSITELCASLSEDLQAELTRLSSPFDASGGPPSEAELRVAQAQLVGWLEGLFHGIQATLFAQQMELRQQMEEMRRRGLPPGQESATRPGTYL